MSLLHDWESAPFPRDGSVFLHRCRRCGKIASEGDGGITLPNGDLVLLGDCEPRTAWTRVLADETL